MSFPAVTEVMITSLSEESPLVLGGGCGGCELNGEGVVGDVSDNGALLAKGG